MDKRESPGELERLYRQAFTEFGPVALWNVAAAERPTRGAALAITPALRTHGSMAGRRLAEAIERLCRAPDQTPVGLLRTLADQRSPDSDIVGGDRAQPVWPSLFQ